MRLPNSILKLSDVCSSILTRSRCIPFRWTACNIGEECIGIGRNISVVHDYHRYRGSRCRHHLPPHRSDMLFAVQVVCLPVKPIHMAAESDFACRPACSPSTRRVNVCVAPSYMSRSKGDSFTRRATCFARDCVFYLKFRNTLFLTVYFQSCIVCGRKHGRIICKLFRYLYMTC